MIICKFSPLICSLSLSLSPPHSLSRSPLSRSRIVRACVGAEPENERKARKRRKIKNSDADGPLTWKIGEKETFSLCRCSVLLSCGTLLLIFASLGCKKKTTLEPTSLEEGGKRLRSDTVLGARMDKGRKCAEHNFYLTNEIFAFLLAAKSSAQ